MRWRSEGRRGRATVRLAREGALEARGSYVRPALVGWVSVRDSAGDATSSGRPPEPGDVEPRRATRDRQLTGQERPHVGFADDG